MWSNFYYRFSSQIYFCSFAVHINVIAINEQSFICNLKWYFTAFVSICIVSISHLYTKSPIFLLWMRVERRGNGFDSLFLEMQLIIDCDDASDYGNWSLFIWWSCKCVLMFLFHLFSHFFNPTILYTLTCLEQISGHYLKFSLFIFLIIFILLIKINTVWNQVFWVESLTFELLQHASIADILRMNSLIFSH